MVVNYFVGQDQIIESYLYMVAESILDSIGWQDKHLLNIFLGATLSAAFDNA